MEEIGFTKGKGLSEIINKKFEIDFEKVKTLDDIIIILKNMNLHVTWYQKDCPEMFKEIYEKGFLKEEI